MIRFLRRTSLVLFVVLPPLFAWGCGTAPTWRRFLGETYQNWIFPGDEEVQSLGREDADGSRLWSVIDAKTGATRRQTRLAPGVDPMGLFENGAMLARSRGDGNHLVFDADLAQPPKIIRNPEPASELVTSFTDLKERRLLTVHRRTGDAHTRYFVAIHRLERLQPPRIFEGFGKAMFLNDNRHVVLREVDPLNPDFIAPGKPTKHVCFDLESGGRLWEATLPDEYFQFESSPAMHQVLFREILGTGVKQPKVIVLDDRTGAKVAEWDDSFQCLSTDGLAVESSRKDSVVTVRGEGFRRIFDLGNASNQRLCWLHTNRNGVRRLIVKDQETMLDFSSLGFQSLFGYRSIAKLRQREWDVDTGELTNSEVQYCGCNDVGVWSGITSDDGTFEIQSRSFLGIRWLQRVERPGRKNIPLRVALGAAPMFLLGALKFIARRRPKIPGLEASASKEAPA